MKGPRLHLPIAALVAVGFAAPAHPVRADIAHHSIDAGGGSTKGSTTRYQNTGSLGGIPGPASTAAYQNRSGYPAELHETRSFTITAPRTQLDEAETIQLTASLGLDDGSLLRLSPAAVAWQLSSPSSAATTGISPSGLLDAGNVHQDTDIPLTASYAALADSLSFHIRNSGDDDFGLYAGDGIDDTWQIEWFGVENPAGIATADPSGTGQNNLFKYLAGLDPLDPADRFVLDILPATEAPTGQSGPYTLAFGPCHPGRSYRLLTSENLSDWSLLHEHHSTQSGPHTFTDPSPAAAKKFYKVEVKRSYPTIHRIATAGDSITAETSHILYGDGTNYWPGSWPTHVRTLLNHRVIYEKNPINGRYTFAVAGARTPIFMPGGSTRNYWEALLASEADTVMMMLGTNDIVHFSANIDDTINNIVSLWDEAIQTNKQVVALGILPCRSDHPSSGFYPSRQLACNARLKFAAESRNIQFIDCSKVLDRDNDGFADQSYLLDTIHPNIQGGMLLSDFIASQIEHRIASTPQRIIPAPNHPAWITPNSHAFSSQTGNNQATGWTIQTAGNASLQSSLKPRTDGIPGNWQELKISGMTESGMRKSAPSDFIQLYTANFNPAYSPGEKLVMVAEVEMDSAFWAVWTEMHVSGVKAGDHQTKGSLAAMEHPPNAYSGVLMTEPWTYTSGSTTFAMLKIVGNGTIRIGRIGVFRIQ